MTVGGGALHIPAAAGRHLRRHQHRQEPRRARRAHGRLDGDHQGRLQGHRPVPPGGHHPAHRRRQLREVRPHRDRDGAGEEKFEFIQEINGTPRNDAADSTANVAGELPERLLPADGLRRDQRHRRVLDRRHDVDPGRAARRRSRRARRSACSRSTTPRRRPPVADFDWFRLEGPGGAGGGTPSGPAATTTSPAPRWTSRAGTRSCATTRPSTTVGGGNLTITTELGDIYTGDTNPPPPNFILQSAGSRGRGLGDRDQAVRRRSPTATPRAA